MKKSQLKKLIKESIVEYRVDEFRRQHPLPEVNKVEDMDAWMDAFKERRKLFLSKFRKGY